jgi:hypothetical protein
MSGQTLVAITPDLIAEAAYTGYRANNNYFS